MCSSDLDIDNVKKIIFGLGAIKGAGEAAVHNIIEERNRGGEYKDLEDFMMRIDLTKFSKRVFEPLARCGSLDNLGYTRATMLENAEEICEWARENQKAKIDLENSLFGGGDNSEMLIELKIKKFIEYNKKEILEHEREIMGIYISGHPLDDYRESIKELEGVVSLLDLDLLEHGSELYLAGKVESVKSKLSKKGNKIGEISFIDSLSVKTITVFGSILDDLEKFNLDEPVVFRCTTQEGREGMQVKVGRVLTLKDAKKRNLKPTYREKSVIGDGIGNVGVLEQFKIYIPKNIDMRMIEKIREAAINNIGDRELKIVIEDGGSEFVFSSSFMVSENIKNELGKFESIQFKREVVKL